MLGRLQANETFEDILGCEKKKKKKKKKWEGGVATSLEREGSKLRRRSPKAPNLHGVSSPWNAPYFSLK